MTRPIGYPVALVSVDCSARSHTVPGLLWATTDPRFRGWS